jgi:hypothetical protein
VSWASEALAAIRKMVLIEDRIERLADQSDKLANKCQELDLRVARIEAKFELLESAAMASRGTRRQIKNE